MKSTTWYIAGFGVAVLGVFRLPWLVPFPAPVIGESYSYGFYNPAAVVALLVALVPILVGHLVGGKKPVAFSWFVSSPVIFPSWRKGAYEYAVLVGAAVICAVAILVWNSYLVLPYWGESAYFLSSIDLARLGYQPYADFSFIYGPACLYGPIGLDWLSGGSLGIENAYAWCLTLAFVLGFLLLFIFQRFLNLPDRDRPWILALTLLGWFFLSMGLQYAPLRFALVPCALALGNHPRLTRTPGGLAAGRIMLVVALLDAACYSVSPEMGITCALAFAAGAVIHFWSGRPLFAAAYLAGSGLVLTLQAVIFSRNLKGVSSFAAGGYCLPIYPNHANVLLVLTALYVLPLIAYSIWKQPGNAIAPLAAGMGAAVAILLLPAMGRCDPGHVLFNEILLFTLFFAAVGQIKRSYLVGWGVIYALAFVVLGQVSYWNSYAPKWKEAFVLRDYYLQHPAVVEKWSQDWKSAAAGSDHYERFNWHKVAPFPAFGLSLAHTENKIGAPVGADVVLDRFLKVRSAYIPAFDCTMAPDLFTPQDVARTLDDARARYDFVLFPDSELAMVANTLKFPPDGAELQDFMSNLLVYPVRSRFRNDPYMPEVEAVDALLQHGSIVSRGSGYTVVKLAK